MYTLNCIFSFFLLQNSKFIFYEINRVLQFTRETIFHSQVAIKYISFI